MLGSKRKDDDDQVSVGRRHSESMGVTFCSKNDGLVGFCLLSGACWCSASLGCDNQSRHQSVGKWAKQAKNEKSFLFVVLFSPSNLSRISSRLCAHSSCRRILLIEFSASATADTIAAATACRENERKSSSQFCVHGRLVRKKLPLILSFSRCISLPVYTVVLFGGLEHRKRFRRRKDSTKDAKTQNKETWWGLQWNVKQLCVCVFFRLDLLLLDHVATWLTESKQSRQHRALERLWGGKPVTACVYGRCRIWFDDCSLSATEQLIGWWNNYRQLCVCVCVVSSLREAKGFTRNL